MLLAVAIGVPLGILITRRAAWNKPILGGANIIQTIPSLALFGFLMPMPWLGARADRLAIAALAGYALLPIIRNTYTGIMGVNPSVREAARGMGMTDWQLLTQVELPLASGRDSGRNSRGHGDYGGRRDHCRRHRRGRAGRVYLSRARPWWITA